MKYTQLICLVTAMAIVHQTFAQSLLSQQRMTGLSPIVKSPTRRIDPDKETVNVLVLGLMVGSHYKNAKELMVYLSEQRF